MDIRASRGEIETAPTFSDSLSSDTTQHEIVYILFPSVCLVLFACAACASQLHHSVNVVRSDKSHEGDLHLGPDIVPRGNRIPELTPITKPVLQCSPHDSLKAIIRAKVEGDITYLKISLNVEVYKINLPCHFDGKPSVVKEIQLTQGGWTKADVETEVARLRIVRQLFGVLLTGRGSRYFVIMKYMGGRWEGGPDAPDRLTAIILMRGAEQRDRYSFGLSRAASISVGDYTWIRRGRKTWLVRPVGSWRKAEIVGVPELPVRKKRRYCGIAGWDKDGLPVILPLADISIGHLTG
ncbi:hypothetical protein APHAL10511_003554 [Amanita phalloides]|nr:hypothetical protein APHAL10511_003554 [Amanita phalloides]